MNRLGIKYQILLITFIPVFLIDVFFTYSHITSSFTQAQTMLHNQGRIISRQLAGASEFNLFTGNDQQIQYLLDQTVGTDDIILAAVYDIQGDLIAESISDRYNPKKSGDYFYYHQAILSQSIVVSDVFSPDQLEGPLDSNLGWILYLSIQRTAPSRQDQDYSRVDHIFYIRTNHDLDSDYRHQPWYNQTDN